MESAMLTQEFRSARKSTKALEVFFWETTLKFKTIETNNGTYETVSLAFLLLVLLG